MSNVFPKTARNQVKRHPERGQYDPAIIYPIVDEALICHVGFVQDQQPYVIPTLHARQGDTILLHGAKASRLLRHIAAGGEVCITITLVDGIVLARSVFNHSINYRSAVIFGQGVLIEDESACMQALEVFTDRLVPGRWQDVRRPNAIELKQTSIVAVAIASASAKIRTGPPKDDDDDLALPAWAGVLPLYQAAGAPVADPLLPADRAAPDYIRDYSRPAAHEKDEHMHIETVTRATFERVLPLIAAYQRFYEAVPDDARNRAHFEQFIGDQANGCQFIALGDAGSALGFATVYFPLGSVTPGRYCLMNDLFTVPESRGQGIGRALILHCLSYAQSRGFGKITWQTALTNATAQRLYDSLPTTRGGWYTYSLRADAQA